MENKDYTFAPFASNPFYQAENANLIEMAGVGPGQRIVDLACGNGGIDEGRMGSSTETMLTSNGIETIRTWHMEGNEG